MDSTSSENKYKKASKVIKAFGFLCSFMAFIALMGSLAVMIPAITHNHPEEFKFEITLPIVFLIFFLLVGAFIDFIGEKLIKSSGKVFIVFAYLIGVFAILSFPIGTPFGVFILYYLYTRK